MHPHCGSTRFICCRLNPKCDGIWRCSLQEAIRIRLGQEGEALINGINALIKRERGTRSLFPQWQEDGHLKSRKTDDAESGSILNLNFPASRTMINICCLSHSVYGVLLRQATVRRTSGKDDSRGTAL